MPAAAAPSSPSCAMPASATRTATTTPTGTRSRASMWSTPMPPLPPQLPDRARWHCLVRGWRRRHIAHETGRAGPVFPRTCMNTNPLLDVSGLPRFDAIRPEHVTPAIDTLLAQAEAAVKAAETVTPLSWDTFVTPLDDASERLYRA